MSTDPLAAAPSEDVEALAHLLIADTDEPMWSAVVIAKHILTSDWLTTHDAQVRADERQKVDTLLREQREGIAAVVEGSAPSPGDAYRREALHHTRAALLAAARLARTFGGER